MKKIAWMGGGLLYTRNKEKKNVMFALSIPQLTVCSFFLLFSFYKEIKSLNIGKMKNSFPYNLLWFVCSLCLLSCFVLLV